MLIGSHFNFFFPTFSSQLPQGAGDISPTWQGSALCRSWDSGGEKKKCTLETGGICSWDGKEGAGSVHPTPPCSQGEEQLSGTVHLTWTQSGAQLKLSSARPCRAPPKKTVCVLSLPSGALPLPSFGSRGMLQLCPCMHHAAGEAPCSTLNGPGIASESFSGVFCFAVGITSHQHS